MISGHYPPRFIRKLVESLPTQQDIGFCEVINGGQCATKELLAQVLHLPGAVRGDLAMSYERLKSIWHPYFFQMPFAEQAVAANDYAFLESWWRDASPEYDVPLEVLERVKTTFRQPGVVTAALNYYRHTFHPANRDAALSALQERVSTAPTPVPTLAFHGTRDRPGRLEAFVGMDDLFLNGLEKVILPGAGHFVHLERPDEVQARIVAFFTTP